MAADQSKSNEQSKNRTESYLAYRRRAEQLESVDGDFKSSIDVDYWRYIVRLIASVC